VALVAEEVLLEHGHAGDDAGGAAGGEGVQFEVGGDQGGGEFGVGGGAGAGAPDLGGDVVEFFAVLDDGVLVLMEQNGATNSEDGWTVKRSRLPCRLQWDHLLLLYLLQSEIVSMGALHYQEDQDSRLHLHQTSILR